MKTFLFSFSFLLISFVSLAQENGKVRVRVFDGTEEEVEKKKPATENLGDRNLISINPYLLVRGAFVVGYERVINTKFSIIGNFGLTYRDFIFELFNDQLILGNGEVTPSVGYYLDAACKWYPKNYRNFEGVYLSPGIIRRTYNQTSNIESYSASYSSDYSKINTGYEMTEVYLKFGYVYESRLFDDLIGDIYLGFGYRSAVVNSYKDLTDPNGNNVIVPTKISKNVPAIYLGFRIGMPF